MGADAESSCTESRTDSWAQDGARNPWSAPTIELWAPTAATHGHKGTVANLVAQCGFVELFRSFALKRTTDAEVKAVLLDLQRPSGRAELATLTGRSPKAVSHALSETPSIVRVGQRWTINTDDGALGEFAAAAADAADDVGVINEQNLRAFADGRGWSDHFDELVAACALARVEGRLALDETRRAALKAVLLNVGRPATSHELAATTSLTAGAVTGYRYGTINAALGLSLRRGVRV